MITVKNLKKSYGGRTVLNIEEIYFERNKCYGILGANGSGKSTFLGILAGIKKQEEGVIEKSTSCSVGYLPQSPYIFDMTVEKNISLALKREKGIWTKNGRKKQEETIKKILEKVGLAELAKENAALLSGGEAQRMAFGRVIAKRQDVILLDEPTSATDIVGIDKIEQALMEYQALHQSTIIFTTHMPMQAMRLADEIIFLNDGKIIEKGTALQVLKQPKTKTVQVFLEHWKM